MIEGSWSGSRAGSGSGSIPLTSGSGSGRPKNMWIRCIRIRIRNTAINSYICRLQAVSCVPGLLVWPSAAADGEAGWAESARDQPRLLCACHGGPPPHTQVLRGTPSCKYESTCFQLVLPVRICLNFYAVLRIRNRNLITDLGGTGTET